jgi:cytidylate kinase
MEIIVANRAGFCFGVKRAIKTAYDAIDKTEGEVATLGPLVHNPQVVSQLEERGVRPIVVVGDFLVELVENKGETDIFVNDCDVTDRIRTPEMGMVASNISAIGSVRQWLSALQRELGEEGNAVLEGRDMGTVVFPDGDVKFFLTASLEERGRRRTAQLIEKGETADLQTVIDEMSLRDRNDTNRALAPLKKADDAIEIDTTSMTVQEVVERLVQEVQAGTKSVPE